MFFKLYLAYTFKIVHLMVLPKGAFQDIWNVKHYYYFGFWMFKKLWVFFLYTL